MITKEENESNFIFVKYNKNFLWRPFEYNVSDFYGVKHKVNGLFPGDVRSHCAGNVCKIDGPIVKGIWSYFMLSLVEFSNKP
jgi:hypothetical protein